MLHWGVSYEIQLYRNVEQILLRSLCIVELYVTASNLKILHAEQHSSYGESMSPTTIRHALLDLRVKVGYFCPIFTKPGFSPQIFTEAPSINFHGNRPVGGRR